MSGRTGGTTPVAIPGRYPEWTDPPLPGGPAPATPGGDRTVRSGGGLTSSALVGPACRVPILFGRCRISPDIVSVQTANYRAEFLCVISEGPIDAVEDWLTDTAETFDTLTVTLGTMATPAPTLQGTVGLAAAYIMTKAGRPYQPRGIFRGMLLYDPRLGSWGAGTYPTPAHTAYSTNPALMMAYLLLFPQFGWGRPNVTPSLVDWSSVEAAADMCDELVSGAKRYEVNLYLQQGESASLWEETIGLHAGLRWTEAEGLWRLDYSAPVATVAATITNDHIVKGTEPRLSFGSGAGLADRPNVFTAEWVDPASDWQVRTVEIRHPSVDAGEPKRAARVYKFHGFHSEAMCLRALWRVACDIWSEQELEAVLTAEMLHLVNGSRVTALLPSLGLAGVDFLVTGTSYDQDQVRITARRYDPDTWTAPGSTSANLPGSGFFDVPDDVTSAIMESCESDSVYSSPLLETRTGYLGISWQPPAFPFGRRLLVKVADTVLGRPALTLGVLVGGSGRSIGDPLSFVSSTGTGATAHVTAVSGGVATAAVVDTPGSGYTPSDYARTGVGAGHAEFELLSFDLPDLNDAGWGAEESVPLAGDTKFNAPPTLKRSLRPWTKSSSENTYDAAGFLAEVRIVAHARTVLIRVESLAGRCSPGVCLVQQNGLFLSSSVPSTVLVKKSAATSPSDGDRAVWDATLGGVRFEAGGGGKTLRAEAFNSGTTTWTAPAGVTEIWVTGCGGGGGGGRGGATFGGGGGGGGGHSVYRKRYAVTPGTGYSVVVGAAGAAGYSTFNGTAGGASSVGALLTLPGGNGATTSTTAAGAPGGQAGGNGGTAGTRGENYIATYETGAAGGFGGISFPGGYGAGGDGGQTGGDGKAGSAGYILIEWNE